MAKQIGLIRFSGKLGETVGRKANYKGTETIGKRATSVRNPKSTLQCVQRMICATASGLLSAFSNVLNNSIEGTQKGAASLAYWRKEWMNMLRTSDILTAPNGFIYAKKGDNYPVPNQLPVSKGMLEGLPIDSVDGNDLLIKGTKIAVDGEKNPTAAFAACNYTLGDQITIMLLSGIDDVAYPSVLRFAFNNDTKPAFVLVEGSTYKLNTEALDLLKCEGRFADVKFEAAQNGTIKVLDCVNYDFLFAAAIIISRKEGQKRSTSSFVVAQDVELPGFNAADAVASYSGAATSVEAVSDIYLDNSTQDVTVPQPEPGPEPTGPRITSITLGSHALTRGESAITLTSAEASQLSVNAAMDGGAEGETYILQFLKEGDVAGTEFTFNSAGRVIDNWLSVTPGTYGVSLTEGVTTYDTWGTVTITAN